MARKRNRPVVGSMQETDEIHSAKTCKKDRKVPNRQQFDRKECRSFQGGLQNGRQSLEKKNQDKIVETHAAKISVRKTRSSVEREQVSAGRGKAVVEKNAAKISVRKTRSSVEREQASAGKGKTPNVIIVEKDVTKGKHTKRKTNNRESTRKSEIKMNGTESIKGKKKKPVVIDLTQPTCREKEKTSKYFQKQKSGVKRIRAETLSTPRTTKKIKIETQVTAQNSSSILVKGEDPDSDFEISSSQVRLPITIKSANKYKHKQKDRGSLSNKSKNGQEDVKEISEASHSARPQSGRKSLKNMKAEAKLPMSPRLYLEDVAIRRKHPGRVKTGMSSPQKHKRHHSTEKSNQNKEGVRIKKEPKATPVAGQMAGSSPPPGGDMEKSDDSDSESDWEEVEDLPGQTPSLDEIKLPSGPVEITLEAPNLMKKKRKKFDIQAWYRRQMNRYNKDMQLDMHKVHLLCLLNHGFHRNRICNSEILRNVAMSVVPQAFFKRHISLYDLDGLNRLTRWFSTNVTIAAELEEDNRDMEETLIKRFSFHRAASEVELIMMYVIILRALGAHVRLVYSLQPLSHKPTSQMTSGKLKRQSKSSPEEDAEGLCLSNENKKAVKCETVNKEDMSEKPAPPQDAQPTGKMSHGKKTSQSKSKSPSNTAPTSSVVSPRKLKTKNSRPRRSASKVTPYINLSESDSEGEDYADEGSVWSESSSSTSDGAKQMGKGKHKTPVSSMRSKSTDKHYTNRKSTSSPEVEEISSGSDFEVKIISFRKSPASSSAKKTKKTNRKVLSEDSDDGIEVVKEKIKKAGCDFWLEIFLEDKWMCVDCIRCQINQPQEMELRASQPVCYILAFDNSNCVKDVTLRYASNYATKTRKLRVDEDWWKDVLRPYRMRDKKKEESEDLQLRAQQLQKPLPASITEYKNHPLYALRRHLLKFEAIYPETAVPLGYVKKEPVFARECVRQLHTRETWMQEARVVRVGEKPYKIVKGRKRKRAFEGTEEPTAELFGFWQTEDFIPPPAVDGKVPRNEYGNVELFQPSMLPGGTVYLQIPGLNRVAKKLGIDCVPAMKGWDHHSGFCHPILDGFVVCEEFKDVLLAAWDEDQEIQKQRETEKREKRALGNWKLLTKGLLVKERLRKRFDLQPADSQDGLPETPVEGGKKATDIEQSWPRNMQQEQPSTSKDQDVLFPFEQI